MDFKDKKLVIFDLDGTLITNNTWFDFNVAMGVTAEEDENLYQQYMAGSITYADWMAALNAHYARYPGRDREAVEATLTSSLQFREGAHELVAHLHEQGYQTAIITGSFSVTAQAAAAALDIKHALGNATCHFSDEGYFTHVSVRGEERIVKVAMLDELCSHLGLTRHDGVAVGDGGNDLDLFAATGAGITFDTSSKRVQEAAAVTLAQLADIQNLL
jgi:phosphoserine phosphatase